MTKRPVIGDPRQHALHKVDVEIARLEKAIAEKVAAISADMAKHALDQNGDLQQRLNDQIRVLRGRVDGMQQKRFDVELGELAPKQPAVAASPTPSKKKWEIKNVPAPTYPIGARQRGDKAALDAAFLAFLEYHIDQASIAMQKRDIDAAGRASIELLMDVAGEHLGMYVWLSERVKELETRVAEIEARPTGDGKAQPITRSVTKVTKHGTDGRIEEFQKLEGEPETIDVWQRLEQVEKQLSQVQGGGIRYAGVWSKDTRYEPGTFVTCGGSMWAAKVQSTGAKPGDGGLCWQLAVKAGRDART